MENELRYIVKSFFINLYYGNTLTFSLRKQQFFLKLYKYTNNLFI